MCRRSIISPRAGRRAPQTLRGRDLPAPCPKYRASNDRSCTPTHSRVTDCRSMAWRRRMRPLWVRCLTTSIRGVSTSLKLERLAAIDRWLLSLIRSFRWANLIHSTSIRGDIYQRLKIDSSYELLIENSLEFSWLMFDWCRCLLKFTFMGLAEISSRGQRFEATQ